MPEVVNSVYASSEPLFSPLSADSQRRVFRGNLLTPEQRLKLTTRELHQIVIHQGLSVLRVQDVLQLTRSLICSAVTLIQNPLASVVHRVVGTALSLDLKHDFDAVAERLITPIADCFNVYEKLRASYASWTGDEIIQTFGSKLHRALRYTDDELRKHEERFYLAQTLLSFGSVALPEKYSSEMEQYSSRFQALTEIVSKSLSPVLRLSMIALDMREQSPTHGIQDKMDELLSCDSINQKLSTRLLDIYHNTWEAPRCAAEVENLRNQIAKARVEHDRAEGFYKLSRVLLTEWCEQLVGGEDAVGAKKLTAIVYTIHDLIQHQLFLKHIIFTVLDEMVHVIRNASADSKINTSLSLSVSRPTQPVCLLDCVSEETSHELLRFLLKVFADSDHDVALSNSTWAQSTFQSATWIAKYITPIGVVHEFVDSVLRARLSETLTIDMHRLIIDVIDSVHHDFVCSAGPEGLAQLIVEMLPTLQSCDLILHDAPAEDSTEV